MGWKGVRDPLYIYGLCRPGGSGVVKWSRAPEPSLNIKYITDSGNQGRRGREVGGQQHSDGSDLKRISGTMQRGDEWLGSCEGRIHSRSQNIPLQLCTCDLCPEQRIRFRISTKPDH